MCVPVSNEKQTRLEHLVDLLLFLLPIWNVAVPGTAVSGPGSSSSLNGDAGFSDTCKELTASFGCVRGILLLLSDVVQDGRCDGELLI